MTDTAPDQEPPKKHWTSYSALTQYRMCPQQWMYARRRRLEADAPVNIAANFGTWWHALTGMYDITRGEQLKSLRFLPEKIETPAGDLDPRKDREQEVIDLAAATFQRFTEEDAEAWASVLNGRTLDEHLTKTFTGWKNRWAKELETEMPMAIEMGWRRDLPIVKVDGVPTDPMTKLIGYVDLVYFDAERGHVVIRDRKTSGSLDASTNLNDMMSSQMQLYSLGASEEIATWGRGPVRSLSYDYTRSTAPKMPKLTATGTLSKAVTDYDLLTYTEWCKDGVVWGEEGEYYKTGKNAGKPKFGMYTAEPEIIEKLKGTSEQSKWFDRTSIMLNKNIVTTHLRSAIATALEIKDEMPKIDKAKVTTRNFTWNCNRCDFRHLCRAEMVGGPDGEYEPEDYGLRRRTPRKER